MAAKPRACVRLPPSYLTPDRGAVAVDICRHAYAALERSGARSLAVPDPGAVTSDSSSSNVHDGHRLLDALWRHLPMRSRDDVPSYRKVVRAPDRKSNECGGGKRRW